MDNLQGGGSGTSVTNPQIISQQTLLTQSSNIQSTSSDTTLTKTPTTALTIAACSQNCTLGVTTSQPPTHHGISANTLGLSALILGVVLIVLFARKVLTS